MGRPCKCCFPQLSSVSVSSVSVSSISGSSSSVSRDDAFWLCVLGQVVKLGPCRTLTTVTVQAAFEVDHPDILCPGATQEITMTFIYNYSTEVMTYTFDFHCTSGTPSGGGNTGGGTFSIKPPLHTTVDCETIMMDWGGSAGAVWPAIICNDEIHNDDCIPSPDPGNCPCLLKNLCLRMIRDEMCCAKDGVGDYPWNTAEWQHYMFQTPRGDYNENHGYLWSPEQDAIINGCAGCTATPFFGFGSIGVWFNWFTPLETEMILHLKKITFADDGEGGMVPTRIWYGNDIKLGLDMDPCYKDWTPAAGLGMTDPNEMLEYLSQVFSSYPDYDYWRMQVVTDISWSGRSEKGCEPDIDCETKTAHPDWFPPWRCHNFCNCDYSGWTTVLDAHRGGKILPRYDSHGLNKNDGGCDEYGWSTEPTDVDIWPFGGEVGVKVDFGKSYDWCETIDEQMSCLMTAPEFAPLWLAENEGLTDVLSAYNMPWAEYKDVGFLDECCIDPVGLGGYEPFAGLGINASTPSNVHDGFALLSTKLGWINCPGAQWRHDLFALAFMISWASYDASDSCICGGTGSGPGGGGGGDSPGDPGPGDPLEIATWDDAPQNFSWTKGEHHIETDTVSGGTKPYDAAIDSGALPSGLGVGISRSGSLRIFGITDAAAGSYVCVIRVVDQAGDIVFTDTITITVQNASGTLIFTKWKTSRVLVQGWLGSLYSATDTVTGGVQPYASVAVASGSLPPGLGVYIGDRGRVVILGVAGAVGSYSFVLRATDNNGNTGDSGTLTIIIMYDVVVGPGGGPGDPDGNDPAGIIAPGETVNITPDVLYPPTGSLGASGLRWAVPSGTPLPSGLILNEVTGAVTGTFPSGFVGSVPLICVPSGIYNRTLPQALGVPTASGGRVISTPVGLEFNTRPTILHPSGNVNVGQGYFTTVWDAAYIQSGDLLVSILCDAGGTVDVNTSSGWNILYPTGSLAPSGNYNPSGTSNYYGATCVWKIAGTGDAAYGTAHDQTMEAGCISTIGLRKPSGVKGWTGAVSKYFDGSQASFEIWDNNRFLPSGAQSRPYEPDFNSGRITTRPSGGVVGIYTWFSKSTTDFQTSGPSGVTSSQFTLNRHGKNAGTFPGFTNPLSMMIAMSTYSYSGPLPVSPISGSPTGCNFWQLEFQ